MNKNMKDNPIVRDTKHIIYEDKNGEKTLYCLYPETCKMKHELQSIEGEKHEF